MVSILTAPIKWLLALILNLVGMFMETKKALNDADFNLEGPSLRAAYDNGRGMVNDVVNDFKDDDSEDDSETQQPQPSQPKPQEETKTPKPRRRTPKK